MYKLMHRVRAYTFDFYSFLSVTYTTLNKSRVVWQVMCYRIAGLFVKFGANPFKNGGVIAV